MAKRRVSKKGLPEWFTHFSELPQSKRASELEELRIQDPKMHSELVALLEESDKSRSARRIESKWTSGKKIKEYEVVDLLGESNGQVYWARQIDGQDVCLKRVFLNRHAGSAEKQALEILKPLTNHTHLVCIHRWFEFQSELIVVMEKGDGSLLTQAVDGGVARFFRAEEAVERLKGVAKAIDYLHANQIVHLDIKPSNLIRFGGETVKLGDYGAIRLIRTGQPASDAPLLATPRYVAPEFVNGQISESCDQYSLAVTYVELRTGQLALELLPGDEADVVARAMSPHPEKRWETCEKFVEALEKCGARNAKEPLNRDGHAEHSENDRATPEHFELQVGAESDLLIEIPRAIHESNGALRPLGQSSLSSLRAGSTVHGERVLRIGTDDAGCLRLYASPSLQSGVNAWPSIPISVLPSTEVSPPTTYYYYPDFPSRAIEIGVTIDGARRGLVDFKGKVDRAVLSVRICNEL